MDGRLLLDTNIIIALFKEDQSILKHLTRADEVFTTSIVLGELYFGALNSGQPEKKFFTNRKICITNYCTEL